MSGETPAGFLHRLAAQNALDTDALTRHARREFGAKTVGSSDRRFVVAVESLGGLRAGFFAQDRARHRLFRRCHHTGWALRRCATCDVVDRARTACSACGDGIATEVFSRGGCFCVRHRRWHSRDGDVRVGEADDLLRAERALSGVLWSRGVTMHTGEFDLARRLVLDSWRERPTEGQQSGPHAYGPVVDLLVTLTHPAVALTMAALAESQRRQVEGLIGLVVGAGKGSRTPELEDTAIRVIRVHRAGMYEALRMPKSNKATISKAPFEKAIAEATFRTKAVFLRHVTRSGRRDDFGDHVVRGAPASRVVSRRIVPGWVDNGPWNIASAAPQIRRIIGH